MIVRPIPQLFEQQISSVIHDRIYLYTSVHLVVMVLLGFMLLVMMVSVLANFIGSNSGGGGFNLSHCDTCKL